MTVLTDQHNVPLQCGKPQKREIRWLIVVVFGSLVLRLFLMLLRSGDLRTDPDSYAILAQNMVQQFGFCKPRSNLPTAFRPPLYPFLLSLPLYFGIAVSTAVAFVNLLCSAVTVISTWWLARLIGLSGRWLILVTIAAAVDPLLLRYSVLAMTEVLTAALLTTALVNTGRLLQSDDSKTPVHGRTVWTAGICFGLTAMCRPVAYVTLAGVLFLLVIDWLASRLPADSKSPDRRVRHALYLAIGVAVVVSPWIIRNALRFGDVIPATTHGGYTLLLGNNKVFYNEVVRSSDNTVWQGESLEAWQKQLQSEMRSDGVRPTDEKSVDRWMYARARSEIRSDTSAFLQACVLRWRRFWALAPTADSGGLPNALSFGVSTWYLAVWAGLVGSLFCGIRGRRDIQMLWLAILSFLVVHTFYWTNTRMRAPLTGVFVVLSAIGWRHWLSALRQRQIVGTVCDEYQDQ